MTSMFCQLTTTSKRRKNMIKTEHQITFEYENYPECTVVALDAKLDDFKGQGVMVDGKPCIKFVERTVKDCTHIDGCIYLHKGHVSDSVMCDLIEKFNKLKKESKDWKPSNKLVLPNTKITI